MANEQLEQWLQNNVALYRRMPGDLRTNLVSMVPDFVKQIKWEGQEGQKITEEMKACVAAEACIPVLRLKQGIKVYRKLNSIEIFPRDLNPTGDGFAAGDTDGRRVRLGWHWAQHGMADGEDGYNLVLHEFAHVIDFASLDGKADGVPPFDSYSDTREWERFVAMEFEDFQRSAGVDYHSMDDYGCCNEAEFFACATESFFERAVRLQLEWPAIYNKLKEYYGMDPATWPSDPTPPEPKLEMCEVQEDAEKPEPISEEEAETEDAKTETKNANVELVKVEVNKDGLGSVTEFHPNGKRACKWDLRNHIHHGPWRRWNIEGKQFEEGWYREGKRDGQYCLYYPNGSKRVEGKYKGDKREGTWKRYYEDSKLRQEDHYEKGELLRWEHWDSKGKSRKYGTWDEAKIEKKTGQDKPAQ